MNRPSFVRKTDAEMETALRETGGLMTLAAKRLGVDYKTVWRRVHGSAKLQQTIADVTEVKLDVAEAALMKGITNGDGWAVCFFLKCRGKGRGYVERQELTGANGGPVAISAFERMSEDELRRIADADEAKSGPD